MCGLKYSQIPLDHDTNGSHPSRVCGLKLHECDKKLLCQLVTPLAGVWIEILERRIAYYESMVTPLAGVWIEICLISIFLTA